MTRRTELSKIRCRTVRNRWLRSKILRNSSRCMFNFFFMLYRANYLIKIFLLIWRTFVSSYFLGFRILTIPYRFYKGPHNLREFINIEWSSIIGNYMPDMMPAHVLQNLTFVLLGEVHPSDHMRVGTAFVNAAYVHYAQLQSCGLYPFVVNTHEIFEPELRVFIISQLYTKIMNRIDQDMFMYSEFINMLQYGTYIRPATRSVIALLVHDCLVSPRVLPYEYVYFKIAAPTVADRHVVCRYKEPCCLLAFLWSDCLELLKHIYGWFCS